MGVALVAVISETQRGRIYLPATPEQVSTASIPMPSGFPETDLPENALRELFNIYGPCLILIDEWVAYARQLHDQADLPGGSEGLCGVCGRCKF